MMNKNNLDEMQAQRRNNIGNQSFLLLLYLLMIDAGLYGFGFRWVEYPANVMIILTICSGIYVIRLISGNAYIGPTAEKGKPVFRILLMTVLAVSIAMGIAVLLKNASFTNASQINAISAPLMFITAAIALIIAVVTLIIKRTQ